MRFVVGALAVVTIALSGCVVQETRPLPQLQAEQARTEVPEHELLDVGVRLFDANIPQAVLDDPDLADKVRIYPDIRRAEARYLPNQLRSTLEGTGQWGVVRVIPPTVEVMDGMVSGRIIESTGTALEVDVTVVDSTGRTWFQRRYEAAADTRSYREGASRARDPVRGAVGPISGAFVSGP